MKEITYNNQKKEIPDSPEELSPKEYYRYPELVLMMNAGEISPFQMRCKLLSCLLGMKHSLLLCRGEIQEELLAQLPAPGRVLRYHLAGGDDGLRRPPENWPEPAARL
ncbi:hypothetical protein NXV14_05735 [Bacteroides fragilis]|nr:hypothetical protein [Bacteroides fragilis]